jgi:hypothetical protein
MYDLSVLVNVIKSKILIRFNLALKTQFLRTSIPKIASQSQFRQEKPASPRSSKTLGLR